jgi:hypothetical protein
MNINIVIYPDLEAKSDSEFGDTVWLSLQIRYWKGIWINNKEVSY